MKQLILFIATILVILQQLTYAEDEVIWETEQIGGLNEVEVSPLGKVLYNTKDSIVQVRNVSDGQLVDEILFPGTARLDHISLSADGRYMAVSGEPKYIFIYDLQEKREVKRLTVVVYVREELGKEVVNNTNKWFSSSISPDGTKVTGVALSTNGKMTNFVVIEIESEEVLFEQRRITYDHFNPSPHSYEWRSAEYSPDGNYIVAQLDYGHNGNNGPDSVYIYNAQTLEIDNILLNLFSQKSSISISSFEPIFSTTNSEKLIIYNMISKQTKVISFNAKPFMVVFSRNQTKLATLIDSRFPYIYDYGIKQILYNYSIDSRPFNVTLDDENLILFSNGKLLLAKAEWNKISAVEENNNGLSISPNPTTGQINISLTNQMASYFQYEIISDSGQIIISKDIGFLDTQNNQVNINISNVPHGHYILRVFSAQEEFTFNIIKVG